ncbi:MAG: 4-hydroxy-tetrahydrodipicolinate synthase [Bacteroidales bacterium]|jgi:4-hydroxy-tetrahydrodipicolinate synthase|nr:4-hydroxy-tetrahydrodipicolinate synthase [Bacteroidales bacterium]
MQNIFQGTGVALVTPFKSNGDIDFESLERLVDFQISNGIDFILALGTTSEAPTLTTKEKKSVVQCIIDKTNGRIPVMVGFGGNSTRSVIDELSNWDMSNISGILSVTPYYNKPSQQGLIEHFTAIANASSVPVILYNVPSRTGVNMAAETTITLAKHKNITGIKEASGDFAQMAHIIDNCPEDFTVLSGDDMLAMPTISMGGNGLISVGAQALPKVFSDMINHSLNNDFINARKEFYKITGFVEAIFKEGNPTGVKAALSNIGLIDNNLRLPLVKASDKLASEIDSIIKNI